MAEPRARASAARALPVVGVLGSGQQPHEERAAPLGERLARLGVHLLTGGGGGVMTSVARAFVGVTGRRGLSIGIVPGDLDDGVHRAPAGYPNEFVELTVATHLPDSGSAGTGFSSRNHLNVLSSHVLVALPGSAGTSSEVTLARRYGRPVIAHVASRGDIPDLPPEVDAVDALDEVLRFVIRTLEESFGGAWRPSGDTLDASGRLPIERVAVMASDVEVGEMSERDWPQVREIYEQGIAQGGATFEAQPPGSWEEFASRSLDGLRLTARSNGDTCGWAVLHPVSARPVYRGVAEVSVYVRATRRGEGIGRALLRALIDRAREAGVWTLQAVVFPENGASIALHEGAGFRVVGRRERLGRFGAGPRRGEWSDVLLLERRGESP